MTRAIRLNGVNGDGLITLVDDDDFEELSKHSWGVDAYGYVVRGLYKKNNIRMHRVVMKTPPGMLVDHIDGNPKNNQKYNLRNCTPSENARNKSSYSRTGYKGVSSYTTNSGKKYNARIGYLGHILFLGSFFTPEDAAKAYDDAAKKLFGVFAKINGV